MKISLKVLPDCHCIYHRTVIVIIAIISENKNSVKLVILVNQEMWNFSGKQDKKLIYLSCCISDFIL